MTGGTRTGPLIAAAILVAVAPTVRAGGGAAEISQDCAVRTGCFPGDAAGFPVTIDGSSGLSYRLTTDLVLPDAGTTAIDVTSPDVHLDLGGFKILTSACLGATASCRPSPDQGVGVRATPLGLHLRNGDIVGMGLAGVLAGGQARLEGLRVSQSAQAGITLGGASVVRNTASFSNGGAGIVTGSASIVAASSIVSNLGNGVSAGDGSMVIECTVRNNGNVGLIFPSPASGYSENTITNNGGQAVSGGTNLGNNLCVGPGVGSAACP